jgi:hypothetical protein
MERTGDARSHHGAGTRTDPRIHVPARRAERAVLHIDARALLIDQDVALHQHEGVLGEVVAVAREGVRKHVERQ